MLSARDSAWFADASEFGESFKCTGAAVGKSRFLFQLVWAFFWSETHILTQYYRTESKFAIIFIDLD